MTAIPNESRAQPAYDDHEARLTKVEQAVTDLQCDNALLRQQMESGFAAVQTQFALTEERLRSEFRDGLHALEQRMNAKIEAESKRLESMFSAQLQGAVQILIARMDQQDTRMDQQDGRMEQQDARMDRQDARLERLEAKIDRLDAKIDQLTKWLIGAQVTTMAFVIGIAVQLFLR
ncbi:hypothetical protein [Duganella radicis]|uniref:DUF1640 domain-containing protein n=1 Tax=Duganella radicis TaxID=551988 RepID=A0A6L6PKE8_9BURK|nr:hypothetical protein [Duganella radicis]MTV39588.1 hypothetical protein [Duganella radicis]